VGFIGDWLPIAFFDSVERCAEKPSMIVVGMTANAMDP
jgi:hypothetical protein